MGGKIKNRPGRTMVPEIWLLGNPGQPFSLRDKVDNLFSRWFVKNEFIAGIPVGIDQLHYLERGSDWLGCGSGRKLGTDQAFSPVI